MDNILEQNNNDPLGVKTGSNATSGDPLGVRSGSGAANNDPLKVRGGGGATNNDPLKVKNDANDPLKVKTNPTPTPTPTVTTAPPPTPSSTPSLSGDAFTDTTLTADELKAGKFVKKGMKGKIVGDIQNLLIKLGYTDVSKSGKADDKFGSRTEKMVKDFQKANDLTDDGAVGEKTWPKLNDPAAIKKGASSSSSAVGGAQAEVPKDGETTAGSDAIIIKESLRKTLRKNLLKFN